MLCEGLVGGEERALLREGPARCLCCRDLVSNQIKELPPHVFDKLTQLTRLCVYFWVAGLVWWACCARG